MTQNFQSNVFTFQWPKADIIAGKYLYTIAAGGWFIILVHSCPKTSLE